MKKIYTAKVTTTGGRDGRSVSSDQNLDVPLVTPKELGGNGNEGTNPEQLFAAGYSACFMSALKLVASEQKIKLPNDISIEAEIGLGENPNGVGYNISADLIVHLPGIENAVAEKLLEDSHQVCPYSNATRGNIEFSMTFTN